MQPLKHPVPFEIVEQDGIRVASNGTLRLSVLDAGGVIFRRRAVCGLALRPPAELLLPHLNQFAGELLQRPEMPAAEAVAKLLALAGSVPTAEPTRRECAVAELGGVRVYVEGNDVVVTTRDLTL